MIQHAPAKVTIDLDEYLELKEKAEIFNKDILGCMIENIELAIGEFITPSIVFRDGKTPTQLFDSLEKRGITIHTLAAINDGNKKIVLKWKKDEMV